MNRGAAMVPLANALMNGVFGLMIEFFTTVVFKAPATPTPRPIQKAVFT
jgi:hypothetical protein